MNCHTNGMRLDVLGRVEGAYDEGETLCVVRGKDLLHVGRHLKGKLSCEWQNKTKHKFNLEDAWIDQTKVLQRKRDAHVVGADLVHLQRLVLAVVAIAFVQRQQIPRQRSLVDLLAR